MGGHINFVLLNKGDGRGGGAACYFVQFIVSSFKIIMYGFGHTPVSIKSFNTF